MSTLEINQSKFKVGETVQVRYKGRWYAGVIVRLTSARASIDISSVDGSVDGIRVSASAEEFAKL